MATNQEQHHLRFVHGSLDRTETALRFLCKDIDAPEVRDAVYRAIAALAEAKRLMEVPAPAKTPGSGG